MIMVRQQLILSISYLLLTIVFSIIFQFSLLEYLTFWGLVIWLIALPGYAVLELLDMKLNSVYEYIFISQSMGLAMLCYFSWLLNAKIGLPYYSGVWFTQILILLSIARRVLKKRYLWREFQLKVSNHFSDVNFTVIIGLAILSLLISIPMLKNFVLVDNSLYLFGTAGVEGLWHIGNIAQLKMDFKYADIHQYGYRSVYHFFSYIPVTIFSKLSSLEASTIFYKFFPVYYYSGLLGVAYIFAIKVFKRMSVGILTVVCLVFMDNLSILRYLSYKLGLDWLEFIHFKPTIISALVASPSHVIGLTIAFSLFILLPSDFERTRKELIGRAIISAFILGALIGFKTTNFIVAGLSVLLYSLYKILRHRDNTYFFIGFFALFVSLPFIYDILVFKTESLRVNPLFFVKASNMANYLNFFDLNLYIFGLIVVLLIYLLLQLGPRLLIFARVHMLDANFSSVYLFIYINFIIGIVLSLIVTPNSHPYNTMYFFRYALSSVSLLLGFHIFSVYELIKRNKFIQVLYVSFLMLYFSGGVYTFFRFRNVPSVTIAFSKVEALRVIRDVSQNDSKIMSNQFAWPMHTHNELFYLYTAISERTVLSEGSTFVSPRYYLKSDQFQSIRNDIEVFYSTKSPVVAKTILDKWHADFVINDLEYDKSIVFDPNFLTLIFRSEVIEVYRYSRAK